MCTLALLHYRWLKPQYEAKYYHTYQQAAKQNRNRSLQPSYRTALASPRTRPPLFPLYYDMPRLIRDFKRAITHALPRTPHPLVKSQLLAQMARRDRLKHQVLSLYKEKVNPVMVSKLRQELANPQKRQPQRPKPTTSPPLAPRSNDDKDKNKTTRNLLGVKEVKSSQKEGGYGLKYYIVKEKQAGKNSSREQEKRETERKEEGREGKRGLGSPKAGESRSDQYYFHQPVKATSFKALKLPSPPKSINTSRKVSSRDSLYIRPVKGKAEPPASNKTTYRLPKKELY